MRKYNKRTSVIASLVSAVILLSGCTDSWPLIPPPQQYSCYWNEQCSAHFIDPILELPDMSCDTVFNNPAISMFFPASSFYNLMPDAYLSSTSYCSFIWTASVYMKSCTSNSEPTHQIALTSSNYLGRLFQGYYGDLIDGSPLLNNFAGLTYYDVKHQLTFIIHNVQNILDGSTGTITWKREWLGDNASELESHHTDWYFYFPPYALKGSYSPYHGERRYIYVHNQFQYY